MSKRVLTTRHERYIRKHYLKYSTKEMGQKLGIAPGTITSFLRREGYKIPRHIAQKFRARAIQATYDARVHPEDKKIKALYLEVPVKQLAELVGRSDTFVQGRLKKLGLKIPKKIREQRRKAAQIKKGTVPVNKGRRQVEFMTPEAIERTKATRFKKGDIPHNARHYKDGDITIHYDQLKDGTVRPYKWIRLAMGQWKMLHVHTWEKKHGPVPEGHIVVFRNGDSMNCRLRNLELITKAEHMRRNTIHRYPEHVKSTIITLSKFKRKIKEYGIEK